jgi:glycosyltransferase involved in cell wall biosynthesis
VGGNRPLRVLLHAGAAIPGGLTGHVTTLAAGLAAAGHRVHLVLSTAPGVDGAAREAASAGAGVSRLTLRGKFDLAGILVLRARVARQSPDIVHLHLSSPIEGVPALLAARLGGARHILTTEHAPAWYPLLRFYSGAVKRTATRLLDAVVAVSESDASVLRERFGLPPALLRVIPNGIPPLGDLPPRGEARARLGLPAGGIVVGYVGPLEAKKGLRDLLEGADRCRVDGLVLVLVGEGSLAGELAEKAARLRFRLVLPGRVEDVRPYLAAFDLFAFPSLQEAMGRALLEAMAAGLPILATRVGGIPEALQNGAAGLLVDPGRPDQITGAIERLAGDAPLRDRIGAAARRIAERDYGAGLMVQRTVELYRSVLGEAEVPLRAPGSRAGKGIA